MKFLITAGPTREALDPARYITNRSSGRMGYALAGAARHEGHEVLLISGPTSLDVPAGVDFVNVESAQDMYDAVRDLCRSADVAILCAAVADYRPVSFSEQKIKKGDGRITIELEKTPDILGSMRESFGFEGTLIGFAAETQNLLSYGRDKLQRKRCDMIVALAGGMEIALSCDMIVANDISRPDIGFDSPENEVTLILPDREIPLAKDSKEHIALHIIEHAVRLRS